MTQEVAGPSQSTGWDEGAARSWVDNALRVEDVVFPWNLAANLTRAARPEVKLVLDAASGPGGFLAAVLDAFPESRGVWFDVSSTMQSEAHQNLERFGDRVEYVIGDLVEVGATGPASSFDLITSSRATHHLAVPDLTRFYQQCAGLLAPNGWLANVDSMSEPGPWRTRLREVRRQYREAANTPDLPTHPQINVAPTMSEHIAALRGSGFTEIELVWRVFVTGLLMARKVDPEEFIRK
ncbi:MAG TPA: class I SAM-dependent methyltransferase [Acidimicrobiales bacterium]|nr:class I SAM-dependent methyltransferase [Acidimicrobiales bacterium]